MSHITQSDYSTCSCNILDDGLLAQIQVVYTVHYTFNEEHIFVKLLGDTSLYLIIHVMYLMYCCFGLFSVYFLTFLRYTCAKTGCHVTLVRHFERSPVKIKWLFIM